jgi:dihydropteridine reductase
MSRVALIFGGHGALGRAIVTSFKAAQWRTINVDVAANADAAHNILISGVPTAAAASADAERIASECATRVDAVICVAGGWRGGSVADNDVFAAVEHMTAFNLLPAITAAHVAARSIAPNGLFVLTGALAALEPQPNMLAYGITKSATHYLLSMCLKKKRERKKKRRNSGVLCVLCFVCVAFFFFFFFFFWFF